MIAPQRGPLALRATRGGLAARWQQFLDDRRAIRLKWGLLALFVLAAALLDLPL